jgi:hypothetical protein
MGTVHYLVKKQLERVLEKGVAASLVIKNDGEYLRWMPPGLTNLYVGTMLCTPKLDLFDDCLTGIALVGGTPWGFIVPWTAVKRVNVLTPPAGGGSPLRNAA